VPLETVQKINVDRSFFCGGIRSVQLLVGACVMYRDTWLQQGHQFFCGGIRSVQLLVGACVMYGDTWLQQGHQFTAR
jgi:hypothetical protein